MTDADYREMPGESRALVPKLTHAQAIAALRLLADRYERVAHYLKVVHITRSLVNHYR